jgi:hypothetical protein
MSLIGKLVIAFVILFIQSIVLIELYPVYYLLEEIGPYENKFNYITGWPLYILIMIYYVIACL